MSWVPKCYACVLARQLWRTEGRDDSRMLGDLRLSPVNPVEVHEAVTMVGGTPVCEEHLTHVLVSGLPVNNANVYA